MLSRELPSWRSEDFVPNAGQRIEVAPEHVVRPSHPTEGTTMKMRRAALLAAALTGALLPAIITQAAYAGGGHDHGDSDQPVAELLTEGLQGPIGSTVGPDGALYVAEPPTGSILRIDTETGETSVYASGLPTSEFGGPFDVTFIDETAYVLTSVVGLDVGGIYRVDGATTHTLIAALEQWSADNPPATPFDFPGGVQYALDPAGHDDGFMVTDGNHNRVLFVSLDGQIRQVSQFDNVVPTGIEVDHRRVYVAQAGPVPHDPSTGRVVSLQRHDDGALVVASGVSFILDVQSSRCGLYAVSHGDPEADAALPNTGELLKVNRDGTFTTIVEQLDLPTSLSLDRGTAYVVSLSGSVWRIDDYADRQHQRKCGGRG